MTVPLRPLADGLIAAIAMAGILILFGADWKLGLAMIGLAIFLLSTLPQH